VLDQIQISGFGGLGEHIDCSFATERLSFQELKQRNRRLFYPPKTLKQAKTNHVISHFSNDGFNVSMIAQVVERTGEGIIHDRKS
jgi:hypothetical protein